MIRPSFGLAIVVILALSVSLAHGQRRESGSTKSREGEPKSGTSAQRESGGKESKQPGHESSSEPQATRDSKSGGTSAPGGEWSERTHGGKQSNSQPGNHNET
ncbi:MAG TPA: hypothetical protein VGI40_11365, partial [Pirellulaceae bacterium]